jgi:hypothetical protein
MKWVVLVFVVSSTALSGQTIGQNATSQFQPHQQRALENAIRAPFRSFNDPANTPPLSTPVFPFITEPPAVVEFETAYAIPLTPAPVDPNVDRRMTHKLESDSSVADRMPAFKGLPVCR